MQIQILTPEIFTWLSTQVERSSNHRSIVKFECTALKIFNWGNTDMNEIADPKNFNRHTFIMVQLKIQRILAAMLQS
jgi:hypothetical protein